MYMDSIREKGLKSNFGFFFTLYEYVNFVRLLYLNCLRKNSSKTNENCILI